MYAKKIFKEAFHTRESDKPVAVKFEHSKFCRAFMSLEVAQQARDNIYKLAAESGLSNIVVLPPLICRSTTDLVIRLAEDFLIVMSSTGAIVPVIDFDALEFYRRIIVNMYTISPMSNIDGPMFQHLIQKLV